MFGTLLGHPRSPPWRCGAALLSEEVIGLARGTGAIRRGAPRATYGLEPHTRTKWHYRGGSITKWTDGEPTGDWYDDDSDDISYDTIDGKWVIGRDFYPCGACWQDTDCFEIQVMPGVWLRGELHREPEWDAACLTSAQLRLTDLREFT